MGRKIDITEKLKFEEKPQLTIKDVTVTINDEAETILKIIPLAETGSASDIAKVLPMLLSEDDMKKIRALKLSFDDYFVFTREAISLVTENVSGEAQTRATT